MLLVRQLAALVDCLNGVDFVNAAVGSGDLRRGGRRCAGRWPWLRAWPLFKSVLCFRDTSRTRSGTESASGPGGLQVEQ